MSTDIQHYVGQESKAHPVAYNRRDLILYALGIGCTDLKYIYELDTDFAAFPTYPIVLGYKGMDIDVLSTPTPAQAHLPYPKLPGVKAILDGERLIEMIQPIPSQGAALVQKDKLVGIFKRGKGAVVQYESTIMGEDGTLFYRLTSSSFQLGARDFTPEECGVNPFQPVGTPERTPDVVIEQATSVNQGHIYRLSGDYNPLHIDPKAANKMGFKGSGGEGQPILHGLCTLGHTARAVLDAYGNKDPKSFRAIKVRFASPVIPGQTLVHSMWKESGNRVVVQTKVKETGKVVINDAYVDLAPNSKL